ncbi:MAG: CDP-diacylglycerol--serine O-phosphatidyltransferase [Pseudomonadota bacterium]
MNFNKNDPEIFNDSESFNLPIIFLIPSIVTIIAICAGLSSIRFALNEKWELAVLFIYIASILDGMDGRLARALNATSKFGAELDSLADFINFGVAPALIIYLWQDNSLHFNNIIFSFWPLVLIFAACSAIRLARFNTHIGYTENEKWKEHFFFGMPAPTSASLLMLPLAMNFFIQENELLQNLELKK